MTWTYVMIYAGAGWWLSTIAYSLVERARIRRYLRSELSRGTVEQEDAPAGRRWKFEGFK